MLMISTLDLILEGNLENFRACRPYPLASKLLTLLKLFPMIVRHGLRIRQLDNLNLAFVIDWRVGMATEIFIIEFIYGYQEGRRLNIKMLAVCFGVRHLTILFSSYIIAI